MSESKLKAQEVSCQAAVSSTVKRTELDEISNFKIGNIEKYTVYFNFKVRYYNIQISIFLK